jgi:hypothetical protein
VAEGVAAEIPDRIARLVPIDGMTVAKGESAMDAMTPSAAERMRVGAQRLGEGWKVPPNPVEAAGGIGAVEAGVSTADIERRFSERRGTHPIGTYDEAVTWAESQQVSRFYIMCTDKPPNASREWSLARTQELRDAGQAVRELPTGHYPMQSMPNALTELLVESALARPSAGT